MKEKGKEGEGEREGGFLYAAWDPFTLIGNRSENIKTFIILQVNTKRSETK